MPYTFDDPDEDSQDDVRYSPYGLGDDDEVDDTYLGNWNDREPYLTRNRNWLKWRVRDGWFALLVRLHLRDEFPF